MNEMCVQSCEQCELRDCVVLVQTDSRQHRGLVMHTQTNYTDLLRLKIRVILSQGELSLVH